MVDERTGGKTYRRDGGREEIVLEAVNNPVTCALLDGGFVIKHGL